MTVPFCSRSAVFEDLQMTFFDDFDPFSGDFRNMQQISGNSVGLSYGVLRLVFRLMTVGKGVNSLFW